MSFVIKPNLVLNVQRDTPKHWIIIGAGGNGAYFIRDFMRMFKIQNDRLEQHNGAGYDHKVTIIDADNIEEKNLIRQNFIRNDVGRNKAEIMADRYGRAFGSTIQYISEYVRDAGHLDQIARMHSGMIPVFLGAVDNNKTRRIIYDTWKKINRAFWIDAGNEEWGGQVVCGHNYTKTATEAMEATASTPQSFRLPCLIDIYPEVFEAQDKLPDEMSCAERAVSAPQNVFTNLTASNLMLGFAYNILASDARLGEGLKCHAVAFNTKNLMSSTTRMNNVDLLQARFDEAALNNANAGAQEPKQVVQERKPALKKAPVKAPTPIPVEELSDAPY